MCTVNYAASFALPALGFSQQPLQNTCLEQEMMQFSTSCYRTLAGVTSCRLLNFKGEFIDSSSYFLMAVTLTSSMIYLQYDYISIVNTSMIYLQYDYISIVNTSMIYLQYDYI